MNNFELDYENDERRIEFMTRAPWLKNKITGQIVYSRDGYPIGDNARDPRWKGYPMSLHFNNGVMDSLPLSTGPTEFYMSEWPLRNVCTKTYMTSYMTRMLNLCEIIKRALSRNYLEEVRSRKQDCRTKIGL
jgi:hypothetical protein